MPKVRWVILEQISCAFQQCKNFENRLRFDQVIESLKMGTFLRHSVCATAACYNNDDDDNDKTYTVQQRGAGGGITVC